MSALNSGENLQDSEIQQKFILDISKYYPQKSPPQLLYELYLAFGPSWKFISAQIYQDNITIIKNPKNVIHNGIRRAARLLKEVERGSFRRKTLVNKEIILSLLEVANQLQKLLVSKGLRMNPFSKIYSFKQKILRLALWQASLKIEEMIQLIRMIHQINIKIRSLGIFKVKSRRSWKVTEKCMRLVSSFDQILQSEVQMHFFMGTMQGNDIQNKMAQSDASVISGDGILHADQQISVSQLPYDWQLPLDSWAGLIQSIQTQRQPITDQNSPSDFLNVQY